MKASYGLRTCTGLLLLLCAAHVPAQSSPNNVPYKYKRLFFHYSDQRSLYEKALNSIGLTSVPVGRSFALIAGVSQFPNFPVLERSLKPAEVDIEKLKSYLKEQEFFDEIVVLKDGDMTLENLNYFLDTYFPKRLGSFPHSRFLFAYSGHGYADGNTDNARGFVLTSAATSPKDPENRIDLRVLRTLLDPVVDSAEKVLVLINACQSGAFLGRKSFGPNPVGPGERGAHAIMASRGDQSSLHLDNVGPGSVFFEKIFAGLDGVADTSPRDGVVTYHELDTYLRGEIPYATNGTQIPTEGDISRNGSEGEFFLLNRSRQVALGNARAWNPGNAIKFGTSASDELERGQRAFTAKRFEEAFQAFTAAASAGNPEAMANLGYLYSEGQGVAPDYAAAKKWNEKAAEAGVAVAMSNLGLAYEKGRGVRLDYAMAKQWYEKAAAAGHAGAMHQLGFFYENGYGVKQDYGMAEKWYIKAAAVGSADATNSLGYLYDTGQGVSRESYEKAAAEGDTAAMTNLGILYEEGRGIEKNYETARQWYEKAAAGDDITAMYHLGLLYANSLWTGKDYKVARQWYKKAVEGGNKDAAERLKELPK